VDAFDADVLIYAATPGHELGRRILVLFSDETAEEVAAIARVGSVLLLSELLTKPMRLAFNHELESLAWLLGRIELVPTDRATAELAVSLGAIHGLRAADAVHLATAVKAGADRFITTNRADFPRSIDEVAVTYPEDLAEPMS
jgi:predicted nucleic acid-binding protein